MSDASQSRAGSAAVLPVKGKLSAAAQALLEKRLKKKPAAGAEQIAIPRRQGSGLVPLSYGQERLWFLDQLEPGSAAYNIPMPLLWTGELEVPALAAALAEVVRRHESLRTVFVPDEANESGAMQLVLPASAPPLPLVDLTGLPTAVRVPERRRLVDADSGRPFDLSRGPLLRLMLVRLADGRNGGEVEHALVGAVHHIVSDGWSQGLLVRELAALYEAFRDGRPSPLPELPIQYADFALWQRDWLRGEVLQAQLAYWRRQLAGAPAVLELPTDRPRPAVQTFRGGAVSDLLPPALAEGFQALGRAEGASQFMLLLAVYQMLLGRYSGQEDVLVGSPIAGRVRLETEPVIGLFVNTLVLRTDLSGEPTFRDLLGRVRDTALESFAHQDVPFEKLVEELRPQRDLAHTPLFQVMMVLQNAPTATGKLGRFSLARLGTDVATAKFDLTLGLAEIPQGFVAELEHNRDLFDRVTAGRMLGHFVALLAAAVADPDRRISDLPLLGEAERRAVLAEWNDTATLYPLPPGAKCLHHLIEAQVDATPEAVALVFEGERLTYRELDGRANRLARRLRASGVGPEVLVGIAVERSVEMVVGLLAILKAGGAYVPIDPGYPADRLAYMIEDSRVPVLLTQERLLATLPTAPLTARGGRVLCLDSGWAEIAAESDERPADPGLLPDHPAYMIYTSGSTGRPKGAVNTHRAIINRILWMQESYGLDAADRVLQKTPFSFDVSVWEFFWPLLTGARIVVARPGGHQDAAYLARLIREQGVTTLHFVPSMLQIFVEEPAALSCASLSRVMASGEALPLDLARRFEARLGSGSAVGAALHNLYGPTEAAVDVTFWPAARASRSSSVPIGRPIANLRIVILDRQRHPVPIGVPGELAIGGVGLARGYFGRPELTADRFVPDPTGAAEGGEPGGRLYRTGDLARWLPDGTIEFLGRLDYQVKLRGFRIELGEIDAALAAHPAVREAVTLAREDTPGDQRLVAYVVPAGDLAGDELVAVLRAALRERLPDYMVPAAFVELPALPQSPNGKLDRRALPRPEARRVEPGTAPPKTEVERAIAVVWRAVLELPEVGVDDNFFDLGGHSLLLVQVQRRLREAVGRDLAVVDLFKYPTVRTLAAFLAGDLEAAFAPQPEAAPGPSAAAVAAPAAGAVAIVGMAGRFPKAASVEELWAKLCAGEELLTFFTPEDSLADGLAPEVLENPRYVGGRGYMEGSELFDAGFFEYSPREAQVMDPQQRVFLEVAWQALEDAGYAASGERGRRGDRGDRGDRIGVFAGANENAHVWNVYNDPEIVAAVGRYQISVGNKTDYLPTRVSYKLDLRGPSVNVQTACSTSLVAVHLACRSLAAGECDLALAGGVSIGSSRRVGYLYEEGGIASPDGHCRAFDAGARGTVGGMGAAVVVLKRLADAVADGDRIVAVVRGTAINNDGSGKVGFTAPSVDGQAEVIAAAQAAAGVAPDEIGYVEAHGTGTVLGDPIEIAALTQAFRGRGAAGRGTCAIGSVKTNLGHLDAAAGVTGLIKAALAVERGLIPPSLHFERPNPEIDFAATPFRVNARLAEWTTPAGVPRRAGVSSFGIGGTNAHAVVEQSPAVPETSPPAVAERPFHLLLLSAKSEAALDAATARLAAHLEARPDQELADVAWTLQAGRRAFHHRRALVCRDRADAIAALRAADPERVLTAARKRLGSRPVAFLFPGQGAQHAGMGAELHGSEPAFREMIDECAELLLPELGRDLRELLFAPPERRDEAGAELGRTALTQPALFAVEMALARLWTSWGVEPTALIGHSIGEYAAACLAGVFTLAEGVRLVAARGRLMQSLPPGAMLGVGLPETDLVPLLGPEVALAAVNAPAASVVSGPEPAVAELAGRLAERGVETRRLHTSHAFHSAMMEPILAPFTEVVRGVALKAPRLPVASNLTGGFLTAEQATDPGYWSRHLRRTVRFADGLAAVLAEPERVLLEVGPGRTLSTLAGQHPAKGSGHAVVPSLRHPRDPQPETAALLTAAARLWLAGVELDGRGVHAGRPRRRVQLPTYPFERQRYGVDGKRVIGAGEVRRPSSRSAVSSTPAAATSVDTERSARSVAPRTAAERTIAELFRATLGVAEIGVHDDFFELGGSSLLAVKLGARLREELGAELSPHFLIEAPTIARLARLVGGDEEAPADGAEASVVAAAALPACLVPVQPAGSRRPLFLVHPAGGHVFFFRELARELGDDQPLWGLRALGTEAGEEPLATVEAMAERYLEAVRAVQPAGPYLLGGSSMGGMVAFEMAQRLRRAGEEVELLALLDTFGPGQMPPEEAPRAAGPGEAPAGGSGLDPEQERRLVGVLRTNMAAMRAYEPRAYPGRLVFFRAEVRRPVDPPRPELPWIDVASEGAEVHVVPGDHVSMHEGPHVAILARRLAAAIAAARLRRVAGF